MQLPIFCRQAGAVPGYLGRGLLQEFTLKMGYDYGMESGYLSSQWVPAIGMTWGDMGVIGGVMFLILAWVALRVMITFGRRKMPDRVHTPTIDRRNREALESMLSLDEIAEQAANEPAPNDLIDAVEGTAMASDDVYRQADASRKDAAP